MTYASHTGWGGTRVVYGLGAGEPMSPGGNVIASGSSAAVGPSALEYAQGFFPPAEGMIEQAWGQLNQAANAGLSTEQQQIHALTLQKLESQLKDLHDEASKFCAEGGCLGSEPGFTDWRYNRMDPLTKAIQKELSAVVSLNQGAVAGQGYKGLVWGLGIATAVAVAGFLVWRQKSHHRG